MATTTSPSSKSKLPIIDISPFLSNHRQDEADNNAAEEEARLLEVVAREWDEAFCNVGFAMIVGHGVPEQLMDDFRAQATKFFEQPLSTKNMYHRGPYGSPEGGYVGVGQESVSKSRDGLGSDGGGGGDNADSKVQDDEAPVGGGVDLVESFILRRSQMEHDPKELAELGSEYRKEMLRVLHCLHEISAMALGLPRDFFESFYDTTDQHSLRLGYYPACSEPPPPNTLRYGEHTDYTGFTILLQDQADTTDVGGLEVKLPDGSFHAVQAVPNTFVVNIGDMFQVWTNDRWKSTVHRVSAPAKACGARLSIPFFSGPNNEARIEPILVRPGETAKHETITAGEHLWRKLQATQT